MNGLTSDTVIIDSNIFEHFVGRHRDFNPDGHLGELLGRLLLDRIQLAIDLRGEIEREYQAIVEPMIRSGSQTGNELEVLRYWMNPDNHTAVEVSAEGPLMKAIKSVLHETKEKVDRFFVAVAFTKGRILVTNDVLHIVEGPNHEKRLGHRRDRLRKAARKHLSDGAEILVGREAHSRLGE